ncbi:hypothetical protein I551_9033 [Mycobacterium ulcerans str. Harvey]|uniref:Uncharacterized protein n=1 Tax=Mycobacterium ulcerans str. Harvey TaxID=1299332 RepID=A0ABN0R947_MYCUL|nr:hypothetical protein I551_9033 [Mycobacterium ulcerans str. Harvey]
MAGLGGGEGVAVGVVVGVEQCEASGVFVLGAADQAPHCGVG